MSVDNSLWSAVGGNEQSYASIGSIDDVSSGDVITSEDKRIEYVQPPEPENDPLIHVPATEEEQNGELLLLYSPYHDKTHCSFREKTNIVHDRKNEGSISKSTACYPAGTGGSRILQSFGRFRQASHAK
jgi:hypothetical protein